MALQKTPWDSRNKNNRNLYSLCKQYINFSIPRSYILFRLPYWKPDKKVQEYMIDIPKNSSKVQFFISYYSPTFRFLCPLHLPPYPLGPTTALLHSVCSFYVGFLYGWMQITTCHIQNRRHGKKKTKILEKYITVFGGIIMWRRWEAKCFVKGGHTRERGKN